MNDLIRLAGMSEDQIRLVSLNLIDRPVKISREIIDPERVRELAESIREVGLLEPILLRASNGRFEVVAGDRRLLAHKLLGKKEIKAIVRDLDDRETVVIRGIENLQRVNLTPSEEGRVYLVLKEEAGLSIKDIAKRTGRAQNTVVRYINFARCPEEIRRAVDRKEISLLCLETLQEIEDPDSFMYFFKMAASNGVTEKVARLWVDDYAKTRAGTYYSEDGGVPSGNVEVELKPVFMTCEVCLGPCDIKLVRNLVVCPECRKKVRRQGVGQV